MQRLSSFITVYIESLLVNFKVKIKHKETWGLNGRYCDIWKQSSGNGQNWETETVLLEEDGERPGKRYRENAAG